MSDTNNDTSAIDEKKGKESSSDNYTSKVLQFIKSIVVVIIVILLYFSSGSLILFLCKLAQSNILPTELNCAPYTDIEPIIKPSPIETNIFTTFTDREMSMKLQIPYDINSKNTVIEIIKNYKENSSSFLGNYFFSIIESLFQFNYSSINSTMNFVNKLIPETVIICLGPIISGLIYGFKIILNIFYFIYLWFSNMSWLFKINKNDTSDEKSKWEDVTLMSSPVSWVFRIGLSILFTFLLMIAFPFLILLPITCYNYILISILFYKAIFNGKQITSFSIILETFKYYKVIIVSIISLFIILLAFSNLGIIAGVASIVTLLLIYYGVIAMNIFQSIPEKNLSPSVSYEQAKKTCSNINPNKTSKKHGFLYNLMFGQKGGNIASELKKIGKKLE